MGRHNFGSRFTKKVLSSYPADFRGGSAASRLRQITRPLLVLHSTFLHITTHQHRNSLSAINRLASTHSQSPLHPLCLLLRPEYITNSSRCLVSAPFLPYVRSAPAHASPPSEASRSCSATRPPRTDSDYLPCHLLQARASLEF